VERNYSQSLKLLLVYEGGYTNDPQDPGGPTNYGIIQTEYDAYRDSKKLPRRSVKYIAVEEYEDIYRSKYANKIQFDKLPGGLDFVLFDYTVNSGWGRAVKDLQRILGIKDDGVLGPVTLKAVWDYCKDEAALEDLIIKLCKVRMAFLRSLKTFGHFGTGWTRRVMGNRDGFQTSDIGVIDYGVMMARATQDLDFVKVPLPSAPAPGKAPDPAPEAPVVPAPKPVVIPPPITMPAPSYIPPKSIKVPSGSAPQSTFWQKVRGFFKSWL
jgi:lysozyme family protein